MDDWVFPVDTKLFKELTRGGVRVETQTVAPTIPTLRRVRDAAAVLLIPAS
jgi:hypothetical protein